MRVWSILCASLAAIALAVPGSAAAATNVGIVQDRIIVGNDDTAMFSLLSFNPVSGKYRVDDDNADVTPSVGCTKVAKSPPQRPHDQVDCPGAGIFYATVALYGGNDLFTVQSSVLLDVTMAGGEGEDDLFGGLGDDTIEGNAGDDSVTAGGGNDVIGDGTPGSIEGGAGGDDTLLGGSGNDVLDGGRYAAAVDSGSGADVMHGEAGSDVADYSKRTAPLTIIEDGQPNDGQLVAGASEGDDVTGAETVIGGSAADRIAGPEVASTLRGGGGGDLLAGGTAGDVLDGGPGADTASYATRSDRVTVTLDELANDGRAQEGDNALTENVAGGGGPDLLTGSSGANVLAGNGGADVVKGAGGNDLLIGGGAADALGGGSGDDRISARDGVRDTVACGSGDDFVSADPIDKVAHDCERVTPRLGVSARARLRDGKLQVRVRCPAIRPCKGRVRVRAGAHEFGSAAFSLAAGARAVVEVDVGALAGRERVTVDATAAGVRGVTKRVSIVR